jgi:DNA-binding transcriptional ArsR family regulator
MDETGIVAALAALAHEHRLRIFRLLVKHGPSGLPAGEIAERVGISATNMSFHLKELDRAGLLRATRAGR